MIQQNPNYQFSSRKNNTRYTHFPFHPISIFSSTKHLNKQISLTEGLIYVKPSTFRRGFLLEDVHGDQWKILLSALPHFSSAPSVENATALVLFMPSESFYCRSFFPSSAFLSFFFFSMELKSRECDVCECENSGRHWGACSGLPNINASSPTSRYNSLHLP